MVKKELTHSSQYGGYVVTISPKKVPLPADTPEAPTPGAAVIVIEVEPDDPGFKFGGGISVTGLRDPVFVARKVEGTESYEVVRDDSRRDAGTVGFATFLNVRAGRGKFLRDLWPGIGIGLETGGNTQYYFGLGLRINAVGIFVNGGAVLGQTAMLPAGLKEGDSISDPNLLATLPKQNKVSWFIGASFSFLGGGKDTFGKPFAGAEPEKQ